MFRPAGLSDDDSDSDGYGYYEKPIKNYNYKQQENPKKKTENWLQDSVINGNLKEVEKIISLDLKNNVNMYLDSGWTVLMHACFHAQKKIVDLLLEKGADPNIHADSVTPVMVACSNSSTNENIIHDIVSRLIECDCLLNVGDKYGETPLMRAVCSGLTSVVELILSKDVNIEMRDHQGWTAVFWAVHHNKANILKILIEKGARLSEVDMSNRTLMEIAESHDYSEIINILDKYFKRDNEDSLEINGCDMTPWQNYYPGIISNDSPNYSGEINHLLYGMNCERLHRVFKENELDLRKFLLLDEDDMIKMGIEMPYERHRLKVGLRAFHTRSWKLKSVAGLQMRKSDHYSVGESLTVLGSHLHQLYILDATLQYVVRDYCRIYNQMKYEPPDSPVVTNMHVAAKKLLVNISNLRNEIKIMTKTHSKISKSNPKPADLIQEKSTKEYLLGYVSDVVTICSLGFLIYYVKNYVTVSLVK